METLVSQKIELVPNVAIFVPPKDILAPNGATGTTKNKIGAKWNYWCHQALIMCRRQMCQIFQHNRLKIFIFQE